VFTWRVNSKTKGYLTDFTKKDGNFLNGFHGATQFLENLAPFTRASQFFKPTYAAAIYILATVMTDESRQILGQVV